MWSLSEGSTGGLIQAILARGELKVKITTVGIGFMRRGVQARGFGGGADADKGMYQMW